MITILGKLNGIQKQMKLIFCDIYIKNIMKNQLIINEDDKDDILSQERDLRSAHGRPQCRYCTIPIKVLPS